MTAIYLPEHDAIFVAIPLYQRWENETTTETNGYAVVLKTFEDNPLAYCISDDTGAGVISAEYYKTCVATGWYVELGEM